MKRHYSKTLIILHLKKQAFKIFLMQKPLVFSDQETQDGVLTGGKGWREECNYWSLERQLSHPL